MRDSILRISSYAGELEELFPGAVHINGLDSGNVQISEETEIELHQTELKNFLRKNESALAKLNSEEANLEIDIGVSVGSKEQFSGSMSFSPEILTLIVRFCITLKVSAYPTCDDD